MNERAHDLVPETLDYDALVADYHTGLVDRLRGFGPAADGLALWVPDEDPLIGLRNLWDAAACAGMPALWVRLGPESLAQLDADALLAMAARFGTATIRPIRGGMSVEVLDLHGASPSVIGPTESTAFLIAPVAMTRVAPLTREQLPAVYRHAVARAAACATHDVPVLEHERWIYVEGCAGELSLSLAIDPDTHCILHAGFAGATDRIEFGVLEALCCIIEGLPLVEAADHGVIRLEHTLRAGAAPVPGIVTPRAVAAAFDRPHAVLRDALASFRTVVPELAATSRHDHGPSAAWLALGAVGRSHAIDDVLARFTAHNGLLADAFALVAIEFDVRLVFRACDVTPTQVMALERAIRDAIDPRLEVYLQEIRDRNKLRRLAIVETDR